MLKFSILLILLLQTQLINSQSTNWKIIGSPDKNRVIIDYVSKDGRWFGRIENENKVAISNDKGLTWKIFEKKGLIRNGYLDYYESPQGKIYNIHSDTVFAFNEIEAKFEVFTINPIINNYYLKLGFLNNQFIILRVDNNILKYDLSGNLIQQKKLNYSIYTFLSDEDKFYVLSGGKIFELDDNLNISNEYDYPTFDNLNPLGILEGRIFLNNNYSDDGGKTWVNFHDSNFDIRRFAFGRDSNLYFINTKDSTLYFSEDKGESFKIHTKLNLWTFDNIFVDRYRNLTLQYSNHLYRKTVKHFTNSDTSWKEIKVDIGSAVSNKIECGYDEKIISLYGNNDLRIKRDEHTDWEIITRPKNEFNIAYNLSEFNLLKDNSILIFEHNNFEYYRTNNLGNSWENIYIPYLHPTIENPLIEKNSNYFFKNNGSIMYTDSDCKEWNLLEHTNSDFSYEKKYDFKDSNIVYYVRYINTKPKIHKYQISGNTDKIIFQPKNYFEDIKTSYNGEVVYILCSELETSNKRKFMLYRSFDSGNNFDSVYINIESYNYLNYTVEPYLFTDRVGNVYIVKLDSIYISNDFGITFNNITPLLPDFIFINDIKVSYDNYLYLATSGLGVIKYENQFTIPASITVSLFLDENNNCLKDNNETPFEGIKVLLNGSQKIKVGADGKAKFYLHNLNNEISFEYSNKIYSLCDESYAVAIDTNNLNQTLEVPVHVINNCVDLYGGISTAFLRRCFSNTYSGTITNDGNINAENVLIKLKLDPFFELETVSLPIVSYIDNELILDGGTIESFSSLDFRIKFLLSCDADLGQEHCIEAAIEFVGQECSVSLSPIIIRDCQPNIGAIDPNDKVIYINGVRNQDYFLTDDQLEYLIRFQNTGTDTAFNVRIEDVISDKFDIESIRPITSSHEFEWEILNNKLVVYFKNILLIDSFKNEPLSHGFVNFSVKLNKETQLGETIENTAGIFFDFNDAVVTNTVQSYYGNPNSINDGEINSSLIVFPNPTNTDISFIHKNLGKKEIVIINSSGKVCFRNFNQLHNKIDVSNLYSGLYFLKIIDKDSTLVGSFVKI